MLNIMHYSWSILDRQAFQGRILAGCQRDKMRGVLGPKYGAFIVNGIQLDMVGAHLGLKMLCKGRAGQLGRFVFLFTSIQARSFSPMSEFTGLSIEAKCEPMNSLVGEKLQAHIEVNRETNRPKWPAPPFHSIFQPG